MKKILFFLFTILICSNSFPQVLKVVKNDGQTQSINLSDINNITFSKVMLMNEKQLLRNKLVVHTKTETKDLFILGIDSVYFNEDATEIYFQTTYELNQFNLADIDSITFDVITDSTIYITYNDSSASVINPYVGRGVSVSVSGADVIVTASSGIENLDYVLSGTTSDGMFKIYSDKKLELHLNDVEITNNDGPAINIQSGKKISVFLEDGTHNILTDGLTYANAPAGEDQKAAFFSEGQLIFSGNGDLTINGRGTNQHGLVSDDYIEINSGNIIITSAAKDGINVNDGFFMNGGSVDVKSNSDGIDAGESFIKITDGTVKILNTANDKSAMKADGIITVSGGNLNITVQGNQSKGIKSKQSITFENCSVNIISTGGVVLKPSGSGYDPSYCTAIKADKDVIITSSEITITASGPAGRGISCDRDLIFYSGSLGITSSGDGAAYTNPAGQPDAYTGHCIKTDGSVVIVDGEITLNNSGKGGKGINVDANISIGTSSTQPTINVTTTGQKIFISQDNYAEAKAISADSTIRIFDCDILISSADDGIKSKDSLIIYNGNIKITQSFEGLETPNLIINGGDINVTASDDGLNTTYGLGGELNDGSKMIINDGYICVSSTQGDALDANGDIYINGGIIVVHGPQATSGFTFEVGLDFNGECKISGGFLVISGTNSMLTQAPSNSSTQRSVLLKSFSSISAGTLFHIEDSNGNDLLTFAPMRKYYSIIFSDAQLTAGAQYKVYTGGTYNGGTVRNGLYTGGTYSPGTLKTTFTQTNMVQVVNF
ncbi:MAG TPA: carbohydrate-binding domain-containing protein [Ignavibacteriaceae bacterium]|mgnify:CR=1 FL=1|jgi:hypothetical protein|nr:MAG: hypothetical protein BWY38_02103 [Ignavibacteria bacterium ADurb.Bin266]OQY73020.1 MAG: hypothetical protein B6D44_08550 [Ignavibacteriales bacterium UTCHB2]HQF42652.1 carbohydrate-binding domain-containing protein [Ignavibacteriaceae bacterium]HQI41108.1 carbohydrate-binding domain-containing protein [Ignavibacteriaceae bacterium]